MWERISRSDLRSALVSDVAFIFLLLSFEPYPQVQIVFSSNWRHQHPVLFSQRLFIYFFCPGLNLKRDLISRWHPPPLSKKEKEKVVPTSSFVAFLNDVLSHKHTHKPTTFLFLFLGDWERKMLYLEVLLSHIAKLFLFFKILI